MLDNKLSFKVVTPDERHMRPNPNTFPLSLINALSSRLALSDNIQRTQAATARQPYALPFYFVSHLLSIQSLSPTPPRSALLYKSQTQPKGNAHVFWTALLIIEEGIVKSLALLSVLLTCVTVFSLLGNRAVELLSTLSRSISIDLFRALILLSSPLSPLVFSPISLLSGRRSPSQHVT